MFIRATGCGYSRVKVPVDGVLEGASAVDESMLTRESMPVGKQPGDALIGASLNTSGALVMRAEKVGAQTVLAQIVQMVVNAQRSRAPMQGMADRVAGYFVLVVIAIALLTLVAWGLFGPEPSWAFGLINAVAVLIIACPVPACHLMSVTGHRQSSKPRRVVQGCGGDEPAP
jgi:Cu+-exporting ATPase